MSFTPPPDFSKVYLAAVAGICATLAIHAATRDTKPHVGDNIHHLPHGGHYQDGNKRIIYAGLHYSNRLQTGDHWAAVLVAILIFAILVSERCFRPANRSCSHHH